MLTFFLTSGVVEESVACDEPTPLPTMKYSDFLKALSGRLTLNYQKSGDNVF
jgi:hypothetical protein